MGGQNVSMVQFRRADLCVGTVIKDLQPDLELMLGELNSLSGEAGGTRLFSLPDSNFAEPWSSVSGMAGLSAFCLVCP